MTEYVLPLSASLIQRQKNPALSRYYIGKHSSTLEQTRPLRHKFCVELCFAEKWWERKLWYDCSSSSFGRVPQALCSTGFWQEMVAAQTMA
ncbi:hypothetical protein E2C01_021894 [Portunus trituberculatus]|uniref:Uncharacterized protein n=1 Tax=Portunus trituberculatus TaxID=210409 RepID=A0A5B7E7G6_PORTR|nr:hypothetical protein [Portunus trituberculatus]